MISFTFLITSCGTTEAPNADNERYNLNVNSYNSEVVAPIILLSYTSCIERHKGGKWPSIISPPGSSSLFSKYQLISDSPDYKFHVLLKSSNIGWNIHSKYRSDIATGFCEIVITGSTVNKASAFTLKEEVKISEIEKYKNLPLKEFEAHTLHLAKLVYLPLMLAENHRPRTPPTETGEFTAQLGTILLQAGICVLFDITPGSCNVSTNTNKLPENIRHEQMHEKLNQQAEKMRQKLKAKIEEEKKDAP